VLAFEDGENAMSTDTHLRILPMTADRLADLKVVMDQGGVARHCWCAYWYSSNAGYKAGWGNEGNRKPLTTKIKSDERPGLIAYVGERPAAWVSVGPRRNFDRLNRSKNFAPIDDVPAWSVNCFVVAKPFRRQGLMQQLALAAANFAFERGAPAVESYPVDPGPRTGASDLYLGTIRAFEAAGYDEIKRPLPRRAIMRKVAPKR
jgi:hypothetical protein